MDNCEDCQASLFDLCWHHAILEEAEMEANGGYPELQELFATGEFVR